MRTISEITASSACCKEERSTHCATPHADYASAFISEFSLMRDMHDLLPLEVSSIAFASLDDALSAMTDGSTEPVLDADDNPTWASTLMSPEREYWIAGGHEELKSLADLKVFALIPRCTMPPGLKPLKGKLVCKRKHDNTGTVTWYKVRYVAKGYAQRYSVDYDKTTAPTTCLESFRTILHIAATLGWDLHQFNIKTTFLHGILPDDETMYMEQPPDFTEPGKEDWVMKLLKSIYGMKQASQIWNKTFHAAVQSWGFVHLSCEWCIYIRRSVLGSSWPSARLVRFVSLF